METLVEQGIVPGYRTNPSIHMQKRKLERARMEDMLRSKISHRPERTELVHRHILEVIYFRSFHSYLYLNSRMFDQM